MEVSHDTMFARTLCRLAPIAARGNSWARAQQSRHLVTAHSSLSSSAPPSTPALPQTQDRVPSQSIMSDEEQEKLKGKDRGQSIDAS